MAGVPFETLEYAAALVGGEEELAERLGVTQRELKVWLSGEDDPPLAVFLKVVDIVHDAAISQLSRDRGATRQ